MSDTREMPRYQSHKTVWALKIAGIEPVAEDGSTTIIPADTGYAPFKVDQAYMQKHQPQCDGYFVVYADGYQSWSPAQAFEEGYTAIGD